jgi:hypothetical protein
MNYTDPVTTTFELQRQTVESGQRALEAGVESQRRVAAAVVDGMETAGTTQRRTVELSRQAVHSTLDAVATGLPGMDAAVEDLRGTVDESYDLLLENHAEAFEGAVSEYESSLEATDEYVDGALEALDEQVALLVEAHEELESQSVEAADQFGTQAEEIQERVEELQAQVREIQERATTAAEA